MSCEISLYETCFVVKGKKMRVDTKACAIGRKNYLETQIFEMIKGDWDLVNTVPHDGDDDLENLHIQIVDQYLSGK